jgi:hypothetical protein
MTSVYFHYSSARGVLVDRNGTAVDDLVEAREQAHRAVQTLITTASAEDWRGWILHVTDGDGEEIFDVPFRSMLGKPH